METTEQKISKWQAQRQASGRGKHRSILASAGRVLSDSPPTPYARWPKCIMAGVVNQDYSVTVPLTRSHRHSAAALPHGGTRGALRPGLATHGKHAA